MASDWEGLSLAPADSLYTTAPTWERIDTLSGCRIAEIDIERGRQSEFEDIEAGVMTVTIHDRDGVFDPTNSGSAYFDAVLGRPIGFALRDPVADEWWPRFRGTVTNIEGDMDKSQRVQTITLTCSDLIEFAAGVELQPGLYGNTPPPASNGYVFYEDTAGTVDDRVTQILATDLGLPAALLSIFSGNVSLRETVYSPGETAMAALKDCADAEFPGVAILYVDKYGRFVFHGRMARFDPDTIAAQPGSTWDFNRWYAGDGAAIALNSARAQVRPPYNWVYSRDFIRNHAMAYPQGIADADRASTLVSNTTSADTYGVRSWSAENLVINEGTTTGNTGVDECALYSQYIVDNYKDPRVRIPSVTLRSLNPTDPRAAATWALMARVDISDILDLSIGQPGGGGVAEEFYVEGVRENHKPLGGSLDNHFPDSTVVLDLSPQAYFTTNVFPT